MSTINRFIYMSLALGSLLTTSPALAQLNSNRFKNSVFSGTMNSNLPSIQTQNATPSIYFAKTSTISFASTMYCGDGDVAAFKSSHAGINFYSQDKATPGKLVLGYWAVPNSQKTISEVTPPDQTQWFSIGSADLTNDGFQISKLIQANTANSGNAYDLLAASMSTLTSISDNATWNKTKTEYSIYVAAMICPSLETTDGTKLDSNVDNGETNSAVSEHIMQQLIAGTLVPGANPASTAISTKWGSSSTSSQIDKFYTNNLETIGVETPKNSTAGLGMVISFGKGSDGSKVAVDSSSLSAAKGLAKASLSYLSNDSSLNNQYNAVIYYLQQLAAGNTCSFNPLGNHNFYTVKQYEFEPFPIKSTCGMAANLATTGWKNVQNVYSQITGPCTPDPKTGLPVNPSSCDYYRQAMAKAVTMAVAAPLIMHAAADELNNKIKSKTSKINKASCLPTKNLGALNDIMKVAGSVHIPIISTGTSALQFKDPGAMVHPEPNFALTEYHLYENTAGDRRAIFNPAYSDSPKAEALAGSGLILSFGVKKGYTFSSPGVNVQFHARAIGCPGPAFCFAPTPLKLNRPGDPI